MKLKFVGCFFFLVCKTIDTLIGLRKKKTKQRKEKLDNGLYVEELQGCP